MSQRSVLPGGMAIGFAGQIADSNPVRQIDSGFNADTANIQFGAALQYVAGTEKGYALPTGPSGIIAGLSVFSYNHARAGVADTDGFYTGDQGATGLLPKAGLQVARKGTYLVPVPSGINVKYGDRGFCAVFDGATLPRGNWVSTNLGSTLVRDCSAQTMFKSASQVSADGTTLVAVLEVDFSAKP